jgi:hypothetical protein
LVDTTTVEDYYEFGDFSGPGWSDTFLDGSLIGTIDGIGTFGTAASLVGDVIGGLEIGDSANRLYIVSNLAPPITPENIGPVVGGGFVNDACDPFAGNLAPCPG